MFRSMNLFDLPAHIAGEITRLGTPDYSRARLACQGRGM